MILSVIIEPTSQAWIANIEVLSTLIETICPNDDNDDVWLTSMNIDFLSIILISYGLPRDTALADYENYGLTRHLFVLDLGQHSP